MWMAGFIFNTAHWHRGWLLFHQNQSVKSYVGWLNLLNGQKPI